MSHLDPETTETSAQIAAALAQNTEHNAASDFTVVPEGYKLEDLEQYHPVPRRTQQTFRAETLESFIAYFNRYAEGDSVIFAHIDSLTVRAVLDYHAPGQPQWGDHVCLFNLPKTPAWKAWTRRDEDRFTQLDFAEFVQDNLADFIDPEGASMLEVARNLEAQRDVTFSSTVDQHSGDVQFTYDRETKTGGKGTLTVPERFKIGIPPFRGADPYEIEADLRFRVSDEGNLTFWYSLRRADEVMEAAFRDVVDTLREGAETEHLYRGKPK